VRINQADGAFWAIVALAAGIAGGAWAVLCCGAWALGTEIGAHGWSTLGELRLLPALLLVTFLGIALCLTVGSLVRQPLATVRLDRVMRHRRLTAPARLVDASRSAGLRREANLVDLGQPFSCTYGVFEAEVVISRGLFDLVDDAELAAVLTHEAHHVRARDPLKVMLARALRHGLFVLPALGDLYDRYLTARELSADRRATRNVGVKGLAGALLKAVGGPVELDLGAAAALAGDRALDLRVAQLETGRQPRLAPWSDAASGSAPGPRWSSGASWPPPPSDWGHSWPGSATAPLGIYYVNVVAMRLHCRSERGCRAVSSGMCALSDLLERPDPQLGGRIDQLGARAERP
jgi:Zn-dependent protease with chaperone function